MFSAGTASLVPNSDGFGTAARQQPPHATQWEVLSGNELSLNSGFEGRFPTILERLVSFHASPERTARLKGVF
jgi:hypothetical protein